MKSILARMALRHGSLDSGLGGGSTDQVPALKSACNFPPPFRPLFHVHLSINVSGPHKSAMDGDLASCKVVLAGTVATDLLEEVTDGLGKSRKRPFLVGFLANKDPASRKYAEWTDRTCQQK